MTTADIIKHEQAIRDATSRFYIDPDCKALPVYDGVVDPEIYSGSPIRVLWILKEPWDGDDCSGGGWNTARDLLNRDTERMAKGRTFRPIAYTTYGILNRIWRLDAIGHSYSSESEIAHALRSIAFINVKKLPGLKRSNSKKILNAYRASRDVILQQINAYQPNYVLGCRPHMPAIMHDLGASPESIKAYGSLRYAKIGCCLFLDVYHPAQIRIKRERYVNDILHVVASQTL